MCASTVQACNFSDFDSTKIAPSIAPYVKQKGESADSESVIHCKAGVPYHQLCVIKSLGLYAEAALEEQVETL